MRTIASFSIIFYLLIIYACNDKKTNLNYEKNSSLLYSLQVDKLKGVRVEWRNNRLLLLRVFRNESFKDGVLLSLINEENQIYLNIGQRLIHIQSKELEGEMKKIGIDVDNVVYIYSLMVKYPIDKISFLYDNTQMVAIDIDSTRYINTTDSTMLFDLLHSYTIKKMKNNWWMYRI